MEIPVTVTEGPRWQSGNTLPSHLSDRGSLPGLTSSGKAGSYLMLAGSLQYRTYQPYVRDDLYSVESDVKPPINK